MSLLSALCGPSARCGQGPRSQEHRSQGRPRRHWAPRVGGPARGCRSCRRFAGLRPGAGKMPALPGTSLPGPPPGSAGVPPASGPQARRIAKRATPTLAGFSSARPRQGTQGRPRRHWAPRARGVAGSGVSLLSALCGPSAFALRARCPRSQEHRSQGRPRRHWAPRVGGGPARGCRSCRRFAGLRPGAGKMPALPGTSLTGPHPGSAGVPPASGPQARRMSKRATPALSGFSSARPRQGTQDRPRRHWAPRARGVAGSGVSLLSALYGPSARCGQDARAPRDIAHRATPWERGRPARKRATGPPHGQAGDAHALGLLQRPSSAGHPRPASTALGASGAGGGRLGCVAPLGTLRAFGPMRARCPRSQGHRSQGHSLGARASRPQAGHRPATWASGRRPLSPWRAGRRPHQRAPSSSSMPCAGAVSSLCRRVALMPTEKPEGFAAGARRQPRL